MNFFARNFNKNEVNSHLINSVFRNFKRAELFNQTINCEYTDEIKMEDLNGNICNYEEVNFI